MSYDTILVPTDGSDAVDPALDHAFGLAEAFDSTVHALYVADTNRDSVTVIGTDVVDALVEVGEEAVASIVERGDRRGSPSSTRSCKVIPFRPSSTTPTAGGPISSS